jgi:hypothetical protein
MLSLMLDMIWGRLPEARAAKVMVLEIVSEKGARGRTESFSVKRCSFGSSFN